MRARLLLALVVLAGGCKAKASEDCALQSDCSGDLICWCYASDPYACKPHRQICTTAAEATASCAKDESCSSSGMCEAPRRSELHANDIASCNATAEGCPKWDVCRVHGKCKMARGLCVAASDAECKRSEDCATYGDCALEAEHCVVKSDADCAASTVCKKEGKCKLGELHICAP